MDIINTGNAIHHQRCARNWHDNAVWNMDQIKRSNYPSYVAYMMDAASFAQGQARKHSVLAMMAMGVETLPTLT